MQSCGLHLSARADNRRARFRQSTASLPLSVARALATPTPPTPLRRRLKLEKQSPSFLAEWHSRVYLICVSVKSTTASQPLGISKSCHVLMDDKILLQVRQLSLHAVARRRLFVEAEIFFGGGGGGGSGALMSAFDAAE